jgi:hypothetical protein
MIDKVLGYGISYTELKGMSAEEFFYILSLADWRSFSSAYALQMSIKKES